MLAGALAPGRRLGSQGADIHDHDGAHATVFMMGTHVWLFLTCLMMLLMVALTLLIEKTVELLHSHVPAAYQSIVHKVLEEFTIMGFVSFVIVLVEGITPISHDLFLNFEWAHLLLFFSSLILAAFGLGNLFLMRAAKRHYDRLEQQPLGTTKRDFEAVVSRRSRESAPMRTLRSVCARYGIGGREQRAAEHVVMRSTFMEKFALSGTTADSFDFGLYLRKSLNHHVSQVCACVRVCAHARHMLTTTPSPHHPSPHRHSC